VHQERDILTSTLRQKAHDWKRFLAIFIFSFFRIRQPKRKQERKHFENVNNLREGEDDSFKS
jgi:preprotein translocase subunit YajC